MRRRQLLKSGIGVAGLAFVSGCSDIELGIGENDEFDDSDPDAMLPSEERVLEVLEGNWVREDPDSIDEPLVDDANAADQYHRSSDDADIIDYVDTDPRIETPGEVTIGVWIYDGTDGAQEAYEDHPDQRRDPEIAAVAEESVAGVANPSGEFPHARVLFRDANAVGWVSYRNVDIRNTELYEMTAIDLAEATHEGWRDE